MPVDASELVFPSTVCAEPLKRLCFSLNYALSRDIAGRTAMRFPDDVFLVAYPGSGGAVVTKACSKSPQ